MTRNDIIETAQKYFNEVCYSADYLLNKENIDLCKDKRPDNMIESIIQRRVEDPPSKADIEILKTLINSFVWCYGWEFKAKKNTLPVDSLIPHRSGLIDISYFLSTIPLPFDIINEYRAWLYTLLEDCNSEKIEQSMWQYHYDIDYAIAKWFTDEIATISTDLLRELNNRLLRSRVEVK